MPVLDGPMTMPVLDGVKPMAITLPICGTSESLFWKRKKKHILLDSVETNLNIWRVRWPSPRQVRVQIPTSPRQVRDDRKTSRVRTRVRDRTRVLQPYHTGLNMEKSHIRARGLSEIWLIWHGMTQLCDCAELLQSATLICKLFLKGVSCHVSAKAPHDF